MKHILKLVLFASIVTLLSGSAALVTAQGPCSWVLLPGTDVLSRYSQPVGIVEAVHYEPPAGKTGTVSFWHHQFQADAGFATLYFVGWIGPSSAPKQNGLMFWFSNIAIEYATGYPINGGWALVIEPGQALHIESWNFNSTAKVSYLAVTIREC